MTNDDILNAADADSLVELNDGVDQIADLETLTLDQSTVQPVATEGSELDTIYAPAHVDRGRVLVTEALVYISPSVWKQIKTILVRQPYETVLPIFDAVEAD